MPPLRRLAITAEDPARLAAFYRDVFELDQIREAGGTVFLSDGIFSLALVPGTAGMATGLQGLGFETARVESIRMKLARNADAEKSLIERDPNTGIEHEMRDPDGNVVGFCKRAFDV